MSWCRCFISKTAAAWPRPWPWHIGNPSALWVISVSNAWCPCSKFCMPAYLNAGAHAGSLYYVMRSQQWWIRFGAPPRHPLPFLLLSLTCITEAAEGHISTHIIHSLYSIRVLEWAVARSSLLAKGTACVQHGSHHFSCKAGEECKFAWQYWEIYRYSGSSTSPDHKQVCSIGSVTIVTTTTSSAKAANIPCVKSVQETTITRTYIYYNAGFCSEYSFALIHTVCGS